MASPQASVSRRSLLAAGIALPLARAGLAPGLAAAQSATPVAPLGPRSTPVIDPSAYAHPDWLVSPAWVEERQTRPNARVVAVQPEAEFVRGHLPEALQIDWPDLEIAQTTTAALATWGTATRKRLGDLGLAQGQSIVVYDAGTLYAARLWWVLRYLGHSDVHILDGGLAAWQAAGGQTPPGPAVPKGLGAYRGPTDPSVIASLAFVEAAVGSGSAVLVDARPPADYAAGHIPGAVNVPYTENAAPGDPKFWRDAADLRALYEAAGATPDRRVVAYCQTGVRSAVTAFTLLLLGYPNARLFTGSWAEWTADPTRPVTVGAAP